MPATDEQRWTKPETILVASNLHELDRLMPHALEQAEQTGAQLVLLHSITPSERMPADAAGRPYYDPIGAEELARQGIGFWCRMAVERGLQCRGLVVEGHPAEQILQAAESLQVGRILLGTHKRTALGQLLLGSVAERVLRTVEIPVMTIGPSAVQPATVPCGQRLVLHATRLNHAAPHSADLAYQIARTQNARLRLLHVLPNGHGEPNKIVGIQAEDAARERLKQMAMSFEQTGCNPVESRVVRGNPAAAILAELFEHKANLLVLGASQSSRLANLVRGQHLYRILTESPCPVLTLRDPE